MAKKKLDPKDDQVFKGTHVVRYRGETYIVPYEIRINVEELSRQLALRVVERRQAKGRATAMMNAVRFQAENVKTTEQAPSLFE